MHFVAEIRTTFPDRSRAETCARSLVTARLAACVQIDGPIASVYRWQGQVEGADEWRCTCKTAITRADACVGAITAAHPYGVPEILLTTVATTAAYAAWVDEVVGPVPAGAIAGPEATA